MPLTIKPLNSASAYRILAIPTTVEYGTLHIWLGTMTTLSDGDNPVVYETQGFIRTTNCLITGSHDCDNLQLEGDLYDFRYLENQKMITVSNDAGPYNVLALKAEMHDEYIPCHSLLSWDIETHIYRLVTHDSAYPSLLLVRPLPNKQYAWARFYISGGTVTAGAQFTVMRYDLLDITYGVPMRTATQKMVCPYTFVANETNIRAILIPLFEDFCDSSDIAWSPKYPYQGWRYQSTSPLQAGSNLTDCYFNSQYEWLSALEEFTSERPDFGELHYRAISKIDLVNVNGIAYLKDIKNILKDAKALYSTLQGNVNPKNLADLFLSFKYGFRQTFADTKEYRDVFKTSHISGVSATQDYDIADRHLECVSTIRFDTQDGVVEDVYNFFRRLDLLISPDNIWELIPFSFVVDWFLDIDGKLKRLDQLDHIAHLNILAVFDSSILTVEVPASRFIDGVAGTINCRRFVRRCHDDASFPLIVPSQPSPLSHWLEGTALIIQRLFK